MALSSAEVTKVFKIFGIPQSGKAVLGKDNLLSRFPAVIEFDVTANVTKLNTILAALTADQVVEVQTQITAWEAMGDSNPLSIAEDLNTKGTIVNYDKAREKIKETLSNIIGFVTGSPGFYQEAKSKFGMSSGRLLR